MAEKRKWTMWQARALSWAKGRYNKWIEIEGDGPYAVVAPCGDEVTVSLHATDEAANVVKMHIDETACGGRCDKTQHVLVDLRQA